MTERGRRSVAREAAAFAIGPSAVRRDRDDLTFDICETASLLPRKLRGRVRVSPGALTQDDFMLDADGRHRWWPIAPACRVEVTMSEPALRWSGTGYLDSNWGERALEADFVRWDWSCARMPGGGAAIRPSGGAAIRPGGGAAIRPGGGAATRPDGGAATRPDGGAAIRPGGGAAILYETWRRDKSRDCLALSIDSTGAISRFPPPPTQNLPRTAWRLPRQTRAEAIAYVRTFEDTPFYARSVIGARLLGQDVTSMHETLSLDRFRAPWMQAMLPFRMRRW